MICEQCRREFESLVLVIGASRPGFKPIRLCDTCLHSSESGVAEKEQILRRTMSIGGLLDILADGFGFVNVTMSSLNPPPTQVYVSPAQIQRYQLRLGDLIEGIARRPLDGERYDALQILELVNGHPPTLHGT